MAAGCTTSTQEPCSCRAGAGGPGELPFGGVGIVNIREPLRHREGELSAVDLVDLGRGVKKTTF